MKIAQLTIIIVIIALILLLLVSLPGSKETPTGEPEEVLNDFLSSYQTIEEIEEWNISKSDQPALATVSELVATSWDKQSYVTCSDEEFTDFIIEDLTVNTHQASANLSFLAEQQVVSESQVFLEIVDGRWLVVAFTCLDDSEFIAPDQEQLDEEVSE